MQSLIRYFIKYPVLGNVIIVALVLFGLLGYMNMRTTFFPPVPSKIIRITTIYPGASPQEIEEGIILKIEDNLKSVTGIDRITSTSRENNGSITIEIESSSDINLVLEDVKNAVNKIPSFPVGMEPVVVSKVEPREFGISFAVSGNVSLKTLKKQARKIERDLLNKDGVSKLSLSGFPAEEIEIAFRENDLRRYNLTFAQALTAVQKNNILTTGGKVKTSNEELLIRANLRGYYANEIENSVVRALPDGTVLRLKDIANVSDRWSENPNRVYFNGKPAVTVELQTTNDEDLFILVDIVTKYIDEFNSKEQTVKLELLRDGSKIVKQRREILEENGIIGIFLVVLLLSLFLNFRLSFWVALAIPLAFLGMFALAALCGTTINVMSLLAMILVIGILVDDGIVIAENIYQHYERGENPLKAAVDGTLEVLPSVTSAILTTVLAFLVFGFLDGAMGDRSKDIAFVVIGTLMISLVEGILILPAHIAHSKALHTKKTDKSKLEKKMESILARLRNKYYAPVLNFSLAHPSIALAIPVAALIITFGAVKGSIIKTTFFPVIEFDRVDVVMELPAGSRDHIVDSILVYMEKKVWQANEEMKKEREDGKDIVEIVTRKIGPGTHQGKLQISLLDGEIRNISIIDMNNIFRKKIGPIPEAEKLTYGLNTRWGMPVSVSIVGGNLKDIRQAKNDLKTELLKISRLKDVQDNDPPGLREIEITLKEKAYALGLNAADIMNQVRAGFFGAQAQRILRGIDEVKVWVRYEGVDRNSISKLEDMRIRLANGNSYPLREIADLSIVRGVMSINHTNGQRQITVSADIADRKTSVTDILDNIRKNIIPGMKQKYPEMEFKFEGQSREGGKTTNAMTKVALPILILMFMIVVFTFRSFGQTLLVFLIVPFSLVGVAWGHFVQGYIMSILSLFGVIALVGIVINDSLVLVNAYNMGLKRGLKVRDAIYEAGISRFRPVILTSLTTIAGLGPLIFESSFQAQFLSPMAIAVAYGLLWGTGLTLLMLPSLLILWNNIKVYSKWIFVENKPSPESLEPAVIEEREV